MSARAADDMVSRCRRVERVMGVDLDDALRNGNVASFVGDMDRASKKFAFAGNPKLGLSMMKSAVRKYGAFVSHKRG